MPDVAGLTVKQAEMALAEARNRERERREYERRKAKGKPLSKITQDAIRYEKCFESGVVKVEKGLYSITCDVDNMDYRNLGESEKEALYVRLLRVYNLFEPTTHLQWSVIVRVVGRRSILDEVLISHQPDGLDRLRDEVNEVLTMADERMYEQQAPPAHRAQRGACAGGAGAQQRPDRRGRGRVRVRCGLAVRRLVDSTDDYLYVCNMKTGVFRYPQAMVEEFGLPAQVVGRCGGRMGLARASR